MRKSRGKREVETYNKNEGRMENCYGENNVLEFPCKKHPTSSATTGGICAYCLTDRLYQLVCPQCGEQRYSSNCSCTDVLYSSSFNPNNSSSTTDVGHRISFLLENDNHQPLHNNNSNYYNGSSDVSSSRPRLSEHRVSTSSNVDDNYATLRRSNSTCVGDLSYNNYHNNNNNNNNNSNYNMNNINNIGRKESKEKFWKIGRLFRKKKDKSNHNNNNNYDYNNTNNNDQENNNNECNGVTRSRSLSSFRGFYDPEESGNVPITSSAARASSVSTGNFYVDSAKQSCFSESEARISNFDTYFDPNGFNKMSANNNTSNNNNNIFSLKETEFTTSDDPAYIDLKLHDDVSSSRVPDLRALRRNGRGMSSTKEFSFRGRNDDDDVMGSEMFRNGSCRRSSVTERELRKCRKSSKVLKWFFKHQQQSNPGESYQDDHPHGFN